MYPAMDDDDETAKFSLEFDFLSSPAKVVNIPFEPAE